MALSARYISVTSDARAQQFAMAAIQACNQDAAWVSESNKKCRMETHFSHSRAR